MMRWTPRSRLSFALDQNRILVLVFERLHDTHTAVFEDVSLTGDRDPVFLYELSQTT
jgi:hypothetical protein